MVNNNFVLLIKDIPIFIQTMCFFSTSYIIDEKVEMDSDRGQMK